MRKHAKLFKAKLLSVIREMAATPCLFVKNRGKDFSRKRKLTFEKMLLFLLGMDDSTLQSELLEFSGFSPDTATVSAFVQQWDKILTFYAGISLAQSCGGSIGSLALQRMQAARRRWNRPPRMLTRRQTKEVKLNPSRYRFLPAGVLM